MPYGLYVVFLKILKIIVVKHFLVRYFVQSKNVSIFEIATEKKCKQLKKILNLYLLE